jgi:hypothetical protein
MMGCYSYYGKPVVVWRVDFDGCAYFDNEYAVESRQIRPLTPELSRRRQKPRDRVNRQVELDHKEFC